MEFLNRHERAKAKKIRVYVENLKINNTFRQCKACKGTGLANFNEHNTGCSWDGSYCSICKGIGYVDLKDKTKFSICDKCDGCGFTFGEMKCKLCKGTGILTWTQAIMRGVRPGLGVKNDRNI